MNEVQELIKWLEGLSQRELRRGELLVTAAVAIAGKKKEPLRGIRIGPDLVLGRDKHFYRVVGDRAVRMPFYLVCEQYSVREILNGYRKAALLQPPSKDGKRTRKQHHD